MPQRILLTSRRRLLRRLEEAKNTYSSGVGKTGERWVFGGLQTASL